jgi:hypothetical protein
MESVYRELSALKSVAEHAKLTSLQAAPTAHL